MTVSLAPLSQVESDARYDYLQRHCIYPVTFYTNAQLAFTNLNPFQTVSYTVPSYSGLAFVSSNFYANQFFGPPLQVQLSLLNTPITTDGSTDTGNILLSAHGISGTVGGNPNSNGFQYIVQDYAPAFIPLPTGTIIYLHYISYTTPNTTVLAHRMVLGLAQTGLNI